MKNVTKALKEEKEAINILQDKNLLLNILKELKKEVVANEDTALALINAICLRLVKNANPTSSNVLISDESGSGKDWITKNICDILVPPTMYFHVTDISEKLLNYWTITQKDGGTFNGRVLHLEDPQEERLQSQAFKVRASGANEIRIVDKGKAKWIHIEGKPVIVVTSMEATINVEGARRWDSLRMDTSDRATWLMKKLYMEKESGILNYEPNMTLRRALQNNLLRKKVIVPYATALIDLLPNILLMRTQQQKLTDYIKASAVLHQHQRERTENKDIIANYFDYDYARFCFIALGDIYGMALSKDEDILIKILSEYGTLPMRELEFKHTRSNDWLYGHLNEMKEKGIIIIEKKWDQQANKEIRFFSLNPAFDVKINVILPTASVIATSKLVVDGKNENQTTEGKNKGIYKPMGGSLQFSECLYNVNKMREKDGLFALTIHDSIFTENHQNLIYKKNDHSLKSVVGKPPDNQSITTEYQNTKNIKKTTTNFFNNVQSLNRYIKENKEAGYSITFDFLKYKFTEKFIYECIEKNILYEKNKNEWDIK